MPIHWTISHPTRLVVAVCKGEVSRNDIEDYLDGVVVADTLPYRQIFDISQGTLSLGDDDMMALGARIRAYAGISNMGPLAIVARSREGHAQARMFAALAEAKRPLKIFGELHDARQWLDAETAPKP